MKFHLWHTSNDGRVCNARMYRLFVHMLWLYVSVDMCSLPIQNNPITPSLVCYNSHPCHTDRHCKYFICNVEYTRIVSHNSHTHSTNETCFQKNLTILTNILRIVKWTYNITPNHQHDSDENDDVVVAPELLVLCFILLNYVPEIDDEHVKYSNEQQVRVKSEQTDRIQIHWEIVKAYLANLLRLWRIRTCTR